MRHLELGDSGRSRLARVRLGVGIVGIAILAASAAFAVTPAQAEETETQLLVSGPSNSLCINPTPGFEPIVEGTTNYAPLTAPSGTGEPFPETGKNCGKEKPNHPIAVKPGIPGGAAGPWKGEIPEAEWVGLNAKGTVGTNGAPKYYIYNATFELCESALAGAKLEGVMFADNQAGAFLNGNPIGNQPTPAIAANFNGPPATGWPFGTNAGFKLGLNTIQFVVLDEGGFTGLDFSATVVSSPCRHSGMEYGRCISQPGGQYHNAGCTQSLLGKWEWFPGPGPKNKFSGKMISPLAILHPRVATEVKCTGESDTGEYTGPKAIGAVVLTFTGCEDAASNKCQSTGAAAGEILSATLEGRLGIIQKGGTQLQDKIGTDLKTAAKAIAEFKCGASTYHIGGSVIVELKTNKMELTEKLKFKTLGGANIWKQVPEKFEVAPRDVLMTSFNAGAAEQTGLKMEVEQTNEEKIEVNSVV